MRPLVIIIALLSTTPASARAIVNFKCGDMNVEVTTTEPDFPGRIEVTVIPDYDPKKKDLHINFRWSEAYRGVGPAYLNGKRCEYLGGQLLPPIRE
jgi:hypothetical protein